MSRTGKNPIAIPNTVEVKIEDATSGGQLVTIKGPKGELKKEFRKEVKVTNENGALVVIRSSDDKLCRSLHGTTRSLVSNMITGVSTGYTKELDIVGVGYRAQVQGNKLVLQIGYSHPVEIEPESKTLTIEVEKQTHIKVSGIDKQEVGDIAAKIRDVRKPEPYKGKGIKYTGEVIRRKAGKSAGKK